MGAIMDSPFSRRRRRRRVRRRPVTHFQTKQRVEQRLDGWMDFGDIAYEQPLGPQDDCKKFWAR